MREPQEVIEDTRRKIRELRSEVDYEWAYERRREYLKGLMLPAVYHAFLYLARYEVALQQNNIVGMTLNREYLDSEIKTVIKHVNELYHTKPGRKHRKDEITDDMIERARSYPFEQLHEFKRGMALCPFHPDRNPSMSLKNNRVRCWSCMDKSMDTIEFVQKRDGIDFPEAVRRLC